MKLIILRKIYSVMYRLCVSPSSLQEEKALFLDNNNNLNADHSLSPAAFTGPFREDSK